MHILAIVLTLASLDGLWAARRDFSPVSGTLRLTREQAEIAGRTVAAGNGGQISMAIPELDVAIVFNGGNYSDPALFIPGRDYVPQDILPAVK